MRLRAIGYWKPIGTSCVQGSENLPDVHLCVDESWCAEARRVVAEYLGAGFGLYYAMGYSYCRLCEQKNGIGTLTDGVFVWPEGLAHYILQHGVRLPLPVENEILRRIDEIEGADVDDKWWIELFDK